MKYMHAIGQHEASFIGEWSVAGADVLPGGQVENRFAGNIVKLLNWVQL